MKKRFLCFILALTLCIGMCPTGAWAADGDDTTGNPPAVSTDPKDNLPDDTDVTSVTDVTLTPEYQKSLNKIYDKTAVEKPSADSLIFWIGGKTFLKPADTSNITVDTTFAWYKGRTVSGAALPSEPINAGDYTLSVEVKLTKTTPPDPNPGGTGGSGGGDGTTREGTETKTLSTTLPFIIFQKTITPSISGTFSKPYDGTFAYEPQSGTSPISFAPSDIVGSDNVTAVGKYSFSGASVNKGFTYTFYADDLKLEGDDSDNYTLGEKTQLSKENVAQVTKANMTSTALSNNIILRNRREHEYTFDLSKVLPSLQPGQQYMADNDNSKIKYVPNRIQIAYPGFFAMKDATTPADDAITIAGSTLKIKTKSAPYDNPIDTVATIEITVTTDNFFDFTSTITLSSANKTQVKIDGLTPVRVPYDGEPEIGYEGTPTFLPADESSNEKIEGLSEEDFVYSYESTSLSDIKYGPTEEPPTAPGVYALTISLNSEDYTAEETLTFTITKAKVTITANTRKIKVDDPIPSLSNPKPDVDYTVEGLAEGDELRRTPTMRYKTVADAIMEGEFDILIDGAEVPNQNNYDPAIEYVPGKLIVTSLTNKQDNPFSDVSEHAWYVTAVKYVYNMGLMNGITDTLFAPTRTLTRGQVVTILYRLDKEPPVWQTMPFTDLAPNAYYVNAVRWASSNRIVNGYGDGRFGPDDVLTREQLAIILYNFSRYYGKTPSRFGSLDAFVDAPSPSSSGYRPLQWACGEGLLQGTGSSTLSPKGRALRAQVAVILMRYCTNVLGLEEPEPAE